MEPDAVGTREPTPTYLRLRVVVPVVLAVVVAGLGVARWAGPSDDAQPVVVAPAADGGTAPSPPALPVGDEDGEVRDRCPEAGGRVEESAADTIRAFQAAAAGERLSGLAVSEEVEALLDAADPSPAVLRMTRIGGFAVSPDNVTTCVVSWWYTGSQLKASVDLVAVTPRSGTAAGSSGSSGSSDSSGSSGSSSGRRTGGAWEVTLWARGEPLVVPRTRGVQVAYFNGAKDCGTPDRLATVLVPDGDPTSLVRSAVEELLSGASGRASAAGTAIPTDVQLVDAAVAEDGAATIELSRTGASLSNCEGKAAVDQVVATVQAVLRSTLPPTTTTTTRGERGSSSQPPVTVLVGGQPVTTLRS